MSDDGRPAGGAKGPERPYAPLWALWAAPAAKRAAGLAYQVARKWFSGKISCRRCILPAALGLGLELASKLARLARSAFGSRPARYELLLFSLLARASRAADNNSMLRAQVQSSPRARGPSARSRSRLGSRQAARSRESASAPFLHLLALLPRPPGPAEGGGGNLVEAH